MYTPSFLSSRFIVAGTIAVAAMVTMLLPSKVQAAFPGLQTYATGDGPLTLVATDLDNDGDADLLAPNVNTFSYSVRWNNGNGTFGDLTNYSVTRALGYTKTGDLDGDDDTDLVFTNTASSSVTVILNNGNGTFGAATYYGTATSTQNVELADLDLDGDIDLVTQNTTGSNNISVLLNNGNGTFATRTNYAAGTNPWTIEVADVTDDGYPDLLVPHDGSHNLYVYINETDGTFATGTAYATGRASDYAFAADYDGDDDIDVAVTAYTSGTVSILLNTGNGTFATSTNYGGMPGLQQIVGDDFDGDGDADLALTAVTSGGQLRRVIVMLNAGDGTFATGTAYAQSGWSSYQIHSLDLDGDGDKDLVAPMYYEYYGIAVLTNDGAGNFSLVEYPGGGPSAFSGGQVSIIDLDGDSDLDAVTANFNTDIFSLYFNDTALPAPSLSTMNPSSAVAGSSGFTMTVTGSGFVTSTQVYFNGSSRSTTVVSPTQVTASILTGDLATAGSYPVVVYNSSFIGGGTSTADTFTVHAASGGAGSGGGGLSSSGSGGSSALPPLVTTFQTNLQNLQNQGVSVHGLIKIPSNSAVYYVGSDGKRHAFPNDKVYFTWYENFDGVQLVNEAQLSSIPLGKNVTYKPGKKMVKFTTDNKVYVVAKGGILRWITTEEAAIALYGSSWNMQIDDISDAFYTNYTFGNNVSGLSDFNPTTVQASVQFPSDSLEM